LFENLNQVKDITEQWIKIYNEDHPNAALGKLSPIQYRQQAEFSSQELST
jgi:putative transposase